MVWECGIVLARRSRRATAAAPSRAVVPSSSWAQAPASPASPPPPPERRACCSRRPAVRRDAARRQRRAQRRRTRRLRPRRVLARLDPRRAARARGAGIDLVIGADLVYHSSQIAPLVSVLRRMLAPTAERPAGARLLLAHKSRHEAVDAELHAALRGAGIAIAAVPTSSARPRPARRQLRPSKGGGRRAGIIDSKRLVARPSLDLNACSPRAGSHGFCRLPRSRIAAA